MPLTRILGRPLPAQSDKQGIQKFIEGLGASTAGVNVLGGARVVFGVAGMPEKMKVLVYANPQAAAAALARSRRLIRRGRLLPSATPVIIRNFANVLLEAHADAYSRRSGAIERAIRTLKDAP